MAGRKGNGEGTIVKRDDGRWCAAVTIGRDSNGKLIRKWIYGKSRTDVAKQMNVILFEVGSDEFIEPSKTVFKDYCIKWLELYKKPKLKPKSFDRLLNTHSMISKAGIGSIQLYQIKMDTVQEYISSLKGSFSYSSVKKAYELLSACFKHAIVKKDIKSNPCVGVTLPREPDDIKEITAFSTEQQAILIKELTRTYSTGRDVYRYGYGYVFIVNTGLRLGEALALTWKDINFEKRTVSITKNISKVKKYQNGVYKGYELIIQTPKTKAARRSVPLNEKAIFAIKHLQGLKKLKNSNIVFSNINGQYIDPSSFSELFSSVCKKIALPGYTVHSLRHPYVKYTPKKI